MSIIYTYLDVFIQLYLGLSCNYNMNQCKFDMWQQNNHSLDNTWQHLAFKMYLTKRKFYFSPTIHYLPHGNPIVVPKDT